MLSNLPTVAFRLLIPICSIFAPFNALALLKGDEFNNYALSKTVAHIFYILQAKQKQKSEKGGRPRLTERRC